MIRLFQISDTHLSPRTMRCRSNYEVVAPLLRDEAVDLVVHTGDVTLDGVRHEEDFAYCRALFDDVPSGVLFIPGNHDIGNHPGMGGGEGDDGGSTITRGSLARYRRHLGADFWSRDVAGWRLIGLDSMVCGSGLPEEQEQYEWLDGVLATAGARRLAAFIHQPVFLDDPSEGELNYWCVDPAVRGRFDTLMHHPHLRLVASGHLHQRRTSRFRDAALEWCSSTAFVAGTHLVPEVGGVREVGCLEHLLHDDHVETRTIAPRAMENSLVDHFIHEIYPLERWAEPAETAAADRP